MYEGHFDEISKLVVVGTTIISASLDGTIRIWDTRKAPEKIVLKEEKESGSGLTEEEERELAELMSDEDD